MPLDVAKSQSKIGFNPILGGNKGDVTVVPWKFDQEKCRKAFCRMGIVDELPFSFVEKKGFMNFMKVAQPFFRIPSRRTVTRDCFDLFNDEKLDNASSNDVTVKELSKKLTKWGTNSMN
uniref:Zinc finger BED domain-containing protein DAYSLEEPER-like n=1 Tax=Nicotiana tabacum TaxID=4097 RepID=A0A1S4DFN6_TOBAC